MDPDTGLLKFAFYEKGTCPNRVLQRTTALSQRSIRSSLSQEVVRRLKNCSLELPNNEKQEILSVFSQKLVNSGHSVKSSQYILDHGVVKFTEMLKNSLLPKHHKRYKPLHCEQSCNVFNRKLKKLVAKNSSLRYIWQCSPCSWTLSS